VQKEIVPIELPDILRVADIARLDAVKIAIEPERRALARAVLEIPIDRFSEFDDVGKKGDPVFADTLGERNRVARGFRKQLRPEPPCVVQFGSTA
jgi:hypothetical protein